MKNCFVPATIALMAIAGLAHAQVQLFSNGPLANQIGTGPGGGDVSTLQTNFTTLGANVNVLASSGIADDFSVPCGLFWTPTSAKFYVYQTNVTAAPSIASAFVTIYDGIPGAAGTSVVFGDFVTNRLSSVNFAPGTAPGTLTYRASAARPLQELTIDLTGCPTLGSATETKSYWIAITTQGDGTSASGPFMPVISPSRPSDNAVSTNAINTFTARWPTFDGSTLIAGADVQDFPFRVFGTQTGTACPVPPSTALTLPATGAFVTATEPVAAGEVKWFRFTLATPIGATSRLDLDTNGSVLTAPSFDATLANDTILALYREDGSLVTSDDDDSVRLLSQLSFGVPLEYSTTTALNFDGRDGATLAAGTYYVGVCGVGNPNGFVSGFGLTTNSNATGTLTVRARRVDGLTAITGPALPGLQTMPALIDGATVNATVPVAAGVTKWVKFTVPAAITASQALDIFTEGSTLTPANDVSLGLYNAAGDLVATDFTSGSGSLALISFGGGFRPPINTSFAFFGLDGANLAAGDYYLAIVGGDTSAFTLTRFSAVNGVSANAGDVNLSIRYKTDVSGDVATAPVVPTERDFGILTPGVSTRTATVAAETVTWFKFEIPASAVNTGALVIDTEGSLLTPVNDTVIRVYTSTGASTTLGGFDLDDGSGLLSQLTYSNGSFVLNTGPLALRGNGRDAVFPAADVYYVAVGTGNVHASGAANWLFFSNSQNSGTVNVNLRYVEDLLNVTASQPPTPTFDLPALTGTVTNSLLLQAADVVWTKFVWPATATTTDWIDIDTVGTTPTRDTIIALYDNNGNRIIEDDDDGPAILSQISLGGSGGEPGREDFATAAPRSGFDGALIPGETYWIGATIWAADTPANTSTFATSDWNTLFPHAAVEPNYTINIRTSLTPQAPACLADVVADGSVDGSDFIAFINSFAIGDSSVDAAADVAGGSDANRPEGGPDGTIDGTDFIAFINAFAAGC